MRSIKAFTLDLRVQQRMAELAGRGDVAEFFGLRPSRPPEPPPETDSAGLTQADYAALLALFGRKLPKGSVVDMDAVRAALRTCDEDQAADKLAEVNRTARELRRANKRAATEWRREAAKAAVRAGRPANISRAIEAMLVLGMDALEERLARSGDGSRSETKNAGQGGDEPARPARRVKAQV